MGLFDRYRDQNKPSPEDLPIEEQPYSLRPSPQGWKDRVTDWPASKLGRFEVLFPYPSDAVNQLQVLLDGDPGTPQLDAAFLAIQALRLERQRVSEYKGTYGAFLGWALTSPGMEKFLGFKMVSTVARDIGIELKECSDPDLQALGLQFLQRVLEFSMPGTSPEELEHQEEKARAAQDMMFRRVSSLRTRDPLPEGRFEVSGLSGTTRPADPSASSRAISLDTPIDRVPEPPAMGPGRRAAAARRALLETSRENAEEWSPEAGPGPGETAFPRSAEGAAGTRKMTAEIVFQTLMEECLKDGKLTPMEMRALCNIREKLGLDLAGHERMLRKVQEQLERNPPEVTEDLDPLVLFERLCWQAADDGRIEAEEKKILGVVAGYLHITPEEFGAIKERLTRGRVP